MTKTYRAYYEANKSDKYTCEELFYDVKNNNIIEIDLDENKTSLYIRQRKDIPITYDAKDGRVFDMEHWTLYLTDGTNIYDIWNWWGVDELQKRLDKCENFTI